MKEIKKVLIRRTYKKPDLNKKRFRDTKFSTHLITPELYHSWQLQYPQFKEKIKSFSAFKRIWKKLMLKYMGYSINNSMGVRLPFYCGDLSIQYINIEYEALDSVKSQQLNQSVPFLNWNTQDRLGKIIWCIKHAGKFNKYLPFIAFKGNSQFASLTSKSLKEKPEIYKVAKT